MVVTHNEEMHLSDCLQALVFADELVVVLDDCTDNSKIIASKFTKNLIEGNWELEGDRRNAGIMACHSDWILEVDSDERVSNSLANEIKAAIENTEAGYFLIPFDNYVGKKLVRYGWGASWGVSAAPRLFRKGYKKWGQQRIHPSLELTGPKKELKNRMVHLVDKNISDMIQRLDRYTSAKAADLRDSQDIGSFSHNIRRIFSRFWKCYVARQGYKEGAYGFLNALFAGLYPILSYLKARLEKN